MGCFCSCFHVPDHEEDSAGSNGSTSDTCFCPTCLIQKFKNKHVNPLMQRQRIETTSPNHQAPPSSTPGLAVNNAPVSSRPRPRVESIGSSRGSGARPEPVGESSVLVNTKSLQGIRLILSSNRVGPQEQMPKSSAVDLSSGFEHMYPSPDEEEECPTCLEEYTIENPKIITKCSHHYHLSCIYEWMERSESCPICGKLMLFDE